MELKKYQQTVINDLADFIDEVKECKNVSVAYREFWKKRNVSLVQGDTLLHPYKSEFGGVPHVTVKVPTAGGKTFIACNAIKTIFDGMPEDKLKVVVWFVP
ncbi:MAG: restriction endonuclease, partial [Prevotella sp.]|nr:restriction endonuclease [Prevotella sp.]